MILCYAVVWKEEYAPVLWACAVFLAGIGGISLWYGFTYHYGYFHDLWRMGSLKHTVVMCGIVFSAAIVLQIFKKTLLKTRRICNPVKDILCENRWLDLISTGFIGYFLVMYFFHPYKDPYFNGDGFKEFCYYISSISPYLSLLGLWMFMRQHKYDFVKSIEPNFYFILFGFSSFIVYTLSPNIFRDHFWCSRRWIMTAIPFILIWVAYGLVSLYQTWNHANRKYRYIPLLIGVYLISFMLYRDKVIMFTESLAGIESGYADLVPKLNVKGIILTNRGELASVLKIVYKCPVYWDRNLKEHVQKFPILENVLKKEHPDPDVYILAGKEYAANKELIPQWESLISVGGMYPESPRRRYPKKMALWEHQVMLYKYSGQNRPETEPWQFTSFVYKDGWHGAEPWGQWGRGNTQSVFLSYPQGTAAVTLWINSFAQPAVVLVYADDIAVGTLQVKAGKPQPHTINLPAQKKNKNSVTLKFVNQNEKLYSPKEKINSKDTRTLGIGLQNKVEYKKGPF